MADSRLKVIFLWHMHQPDYRDPEGGTALLPWVRLHGVKDYLDMVTLLDDFPGIRQNFNLVPSLLDQLSEYVDGKLSDRGLELSRKEAAALDAAERAELLESFFHVHWDNLVKPYPRYWELLKKRGFHPPRAALNEIQRYFSDQELLDLQVWYNLVWIDPLFRREYELLPRLLARGRNFSEPEKLELLELQRRICARIVPAYRERAAAGRIELSTTPYYHPILPLLLDSACARVSRPHDPQPKLRFLHPEDAQIQIRRAVKRHTEFFGQPPQGMWPSEGAVSQELIPLIHAAGIRWIATDEAVLANSEPLIDKVHSEISPALPTARFHAWEVREGSARAKVIFRDHELSDLIGFVYSHWNEQQAADDFIGRLLKIKRTLGSRAGESVVAIILDGENAWEHYQDDGAPFLRELYGRLQGSAELEATTIGDYLAGRQRPAPRLRRLHPGSWIDASFRIWIGHPEKNRAWELLGEARRELILAGPGRQNEPQKGPVEPPTEKLADASAMGMNRAWEHLYKAEGSDWFWWYGDDHSSENDAVFDELFRRHLMAVYRHAGLEIPENLHQSLIASDRILQPATGITAFIDPGITGESGGYYDWHGAAHCEAAGSSGTMHRSEYLVREMFYGFNQDYFFLRLDLDRQTILAEGCFPSLRLLTSKGLIFRCWLEAGAAAEGGNGTDKKQQKLILRFETVNPRGERTHSGESRLMIPEAVYRQELAFAVKEVLTLKIAFRLLRLQPGDDLDFAVTIHQRGMELQRLPAGGYYHLTVPDPDFEARMWYV